MSHVVIVSNYLTAVLDRALHLNFGETLLDEGVGGLLDSEVLAPFGASLETEALPVDLHWQVMSKVGLSLVVELPLAKGSNSI